MPQQELNIESHQKISPPKKYDNATIIVRTSRWYVQVQQVVSENRIEIQELAEFVHRDAEIYQQI